MKAKARIDGEVQEVNLPLAGVVIRILLALALCVALLVAGCSGAKEYSRWQKRADARNKTEIVRQGIKTANEQAKVNYAQIEATKAEAQKRREEAKGIKDAQDTIQATLTDRYLQHEAIEAQKAVATSGTNNTILYVPSGANGVPLVQTPPLRDAGAMP